MSKLINCRAVCKFLKANNDYIILTHTSPDGDTLGSAYALALGLMSMGKRAYVVCSDDIPNRYDYFVKKVQLSPIDYKTIVAVDVADPKLLGELYSTCKDRVELCIDHHISNTGYAAKLYLDDKASATAECIYEILKMLKVEITPLIAECLYTGIATDTGCFKYSNVTEKTHLITAELYKKNINAAEINRLMFDTKSKARLELEKMVLETAEFHFDNRCIVLTVTDEMQKKSGCEPSDLEGVAVISRSVEGVVVGVSIKQNDEKTYKISLRTYDPINASAICGTLGGGGHKGAAGCTLTGELGEVKAQILSAVKSALEENDARATDN